MAEQSIHQKNVETDGVRLIHVTFFKDEYAKTMSTKDMALWELRDLILTTSADAKDDLQYLKLAWFGNRPSDKNCLRNNANVDGLSGSVAEHDASTMSFDEAVRRLREARVTALVYTSPSNTEAKPRWRVVAPTSESCPPDLHSRLIARLNGILGGVLSGESFTLSQSYYFGKINGNPYHRVEMTFGEYINLRDDLDETAIYKKSNSKIDNLQLTDVKGIKPDVPISSLTDDRLKSVPAEAIYMIEHAEPPVNASEKVRGHKGGKAHCYVVGSLVRAGLNNAQIKAVYRLGKIAIGPSGHSRRFDGYVERVIALCRSTQREKAKPGVNLGDFRAYMPMHNYIYMPTREPWPAASVNARLGSIPLVNSNGEPMLDDKGKQQTMPASVWLDRNRPVEQMTWAPGLPALISNRLMADGGWIHRPDVTCLNLYRPPIISLGDASKAKPWIEHVHGVYPNDARHIVIYLAQRVQRPAEKINHGLVLGGLPGIGKDTILEPVKRAVGPWNFTEISPHQIMRTDFNGYLKSVILRVNEARDLGETNRFQFYEHMKPYLASPPDVLRCNEKYLHEHAVANVCGVIFTTNYKTNGLYLPGDDRRHYVAWSDVKQEDISDGYWKELWGWYENHNGYAHVAAYLHTLDISAFNPKAPPAKTEAFWAIVDANQAPEESELADILDLMDKPAAVTLNDIRNASGLHSQFSWWLNDRRNRRLIPHRFESCGYVPVRNDTAEDGRWKINDARQVIYARRDLSLQDQLVAARERVRAG